MSTDGHATLTVREYLRRSLGETIHWEPGAEGRPAPPDGEEGRLGRYPVTGWLGAGAMAEVLQVHDGDLSRELAAKVLKQGSPSSVGLRKFVQEARITGQLEHPNIVPVHELGVAQDGRLYFTMRRVAGEDLQQVLERQAELESQGEPGVLFKCRARTEQQATRSRLRVELLQIFLKICDAIGFAHSRGVIHRDLKPSNVMIGRFGEVQVMDWGLAAAPGSRSSSEGGEPAAQDPFQTLDGTILGTPAYMSPEQADGRISELDAKSDIYSLGAVLYHILTLHAPYASGDSAMDVVRQVRRGELVPPRERAPERGIPWELEAVVLTAMARDPRERYASVAAMQADVEAYLEGGMLVAASYTPGQALRKWAGRHPAVVSSVLAMLAVGAVALVKFQLKNAALRRERDSALAAKARAARQEQRARRNAEDVYRLADRLKVESYRREVDALWPARPELVPRMAGWLTRARELQTSLPAHRARLAELRRDGRRDGGAWRFAVGRRQWFHDTLAELVGAIEGLAPLAADVERRLAFARTIERKSLGQHAAAWSQAVREIADPKACPKYGGLKLRPQLGLVPLGRDPHSGMWEFAQLATGEPPRRRAGKLTLTEGSALVFVLLPGGRFRMGAQRLDSRAPGFDPGAGLAETPPHPRLIRAFFISKYEMTQGQWLRAMGGNPSAYRAPREAGGRRFTLLHPVEQVSWRQAREAMRRLGLALPTEAQWEYAARAGTTTPWWTGDDPLSLQGAANLADRSARIGGPESWPHFDALVDGHVAHAPVGSFRANTFGLHDTAGNVQEWCDNPYHRYGKPLPGPGEDPQPIYRGGAFDDPPVRARSATRSYTGPDNHHSSIGLRPVRVIE